MRDLVWIVGIAVALSALVLGVYYYPVVTVPLLVVLLVLSAVWLFDSIGSVNKDEVALKKWWGRLQKKIFRSGSVLVPSSFGIKFDGNPLCELVRIPKKPLNFELPGNVNDNVWSSDQQKMLVDITGFVRFPYDEVDSLVLVAESDVPTKEAELQKWLKPEITACVRDILAGYTHKEAMEKSKLSAIREAVQGFVVKKTGLFAKSGICGNDGTNFEPGTGEVVVRVETIRVGPKLEGAMEAPVLAGYQRDAAKIIAEAEGTRIYGPIEKGTAAGLNKEDATALRRDALAAESGGLTIDKSEIDVRSAGQSIKDSNFGAVLGLAGAVASQVGRAKKGRGGGSKGGGKGSQNPSNPGGQGQPGGQGGNPTTPGGTGGKPPGDPQYKKSADDHFKKHGVYPKWDPLKRAPMES